MGQGDDCAGDAFGLAQRLHRVGKMFGRNLPGDQDRVQAAFGAARIEQLRCPQMRGWIGQVDEYGCSPVDLHEFLPPGR